MLERSRIGVRLDLAPVEDLDGRLGRRFKSAINLLGVARHFGSANGQIRRLNLQRSRV